ncbi:MAG: DUF3090 family protein [Corynebacteriales bacterium]|nr:DUF3090 family protein [Mycobacteriales bacterium]
MARQVFEFHTPERFVIGTVGEPGDRSFFLQASDGARIVSVSLEKIQAALLAERLAELLEEAKERFGVQVPDVASALDVEPLLTPVEPEFRVGSLGLIWDATDEMVVVEASAEGDNEDESDEVRDLLRVRLTPDAARGFIVRAIRVVAAGRPPCPLCNFPLDPAGHICPRQNGYRRIAR